MGGWRNKVREMKSEGVRLNKRGGGRSFGKTRSGVIDVSGEGSGQVEGGGGLADWLLQRSRWKRSTVDLCQDDGLGNNSGCRPAGLPAEALGPNARRSGPAGTSLDDYKLVLNVEPPPTPPPIPLPLQIPHIQVSVAQPYRW